MSPSQADVPKKPSSAIDIGRIGRLARKELREILRDRRTIVTLVLMPLLLYPLLGIVIQKFVLSTVSNTPPPFFILCETKPVGDALELLMREGDRILLADQEAPDKPPINVRFLFPDSSESTVDLEQSVSDGVCDLGVRLIQTSTDEPGSAESQRREFQLVYRSEAALSKQAYEVVKERLSAVNQRFAEHLLARAGINVPPPAPFVSQDLPGGDTVSIVTLIPLLLVLMTITGAVYPAIDLTAGERERGTMEILIAAPVPRLTLLLAKFVAVLTVAMLTAVFNLTAMLITTYTLGIESLLFGDQGLSLLVMAEILLLLMLFAGFFSAVLLGITSVARSFKEAQAYLIPVMLVALAPGLACMMPGLEFSIQLAVVPLVNIVLLGRDLLTGSVDPTLAVVTVISTLLYGLLALAVAAQVFGGDAILYSSAGTWSDLFRKPAERRSEPTLAGAMVALCLLFPGFIILGSIPRRLAGNFDLSLMETESGRAILTQVFTAQMIGNTVVTVLLFFALPFTLARLMNLVARTTFSLRGTSFLWFLSAAFLGCSLWPFIYELELVLLSDVRIEGLKELFASLKVVLEATPFPVKLLALAIAPAICEEFFFRGFLLSAFRKHSTGALDSFANSVFLGKHLRRGFQQHANAIAAVAGSALLFGIFHVVMRDVLLFERIVPSTVMGVFLAVLCIRSGSIYPGMLLHLLHNGLLVTLASFHAELQELGIGVEEREHLPHMWLLIALVPAALGLVMLCFLRGRKPVESDITNADSADTPPNAEIPQP